MAERQLQDEQLPAHKRRTGRIGSLHEFQQRALSYDYDEDKASSGSVGVGVGVGVGQEGAGHDAQDGASQGPARTSLGARNTSLGARNTSFGDVYVDLSATSADGRSDESDVFESYRRFAAQRSASSNSLFGGPRAKASNLRRYYHRQLKVLSFLVLLGVIGGPLNYSIRLLYDQILALRVYLIGHTSSTVLQFLIWTAHTLVFSQLGLFITRFKPVAAGSGVSQIKSILTGVDPRMYLPGYFDFATLLTKIAGLACAMGAGLIVGTEGAYVHIMSIITHHLLRLPMYRSFCERLNARLQLLAAACAVGVSSTFSSPIGGVLFSMEVTSTYYLISNYMKAFISAVAGALMLRLTLVLAKSTSQEASSAILTTAFPETPYNFWEIPLYAVLGCVLGLLSTGMLWLLRHIARIRRAFSQSKSRRKQFLVVWVDPIVTAIITAALTYFPGEYARSSSLTDLSTLFTEDALPPQWHVVSKYYALATLGMVYTLLLPLCISLRLPTGVWIPTFIAGAAFGRLFGEVLNTFSSSAVIPGTYALAGAAAFGGASTRTISVAVITLEITGDMTLMLPIFCAILSAMGVSHLFTEVSVYDTLLAVGEMPNLPLVDFDPQLSAGDIVESSLVFICKRTNVARLLLALQRFPDQEIPVVQNEATMILLGVVSSAQLKKFVRNFYDANNIPDVDVDLGEQVKSASTGFSWATMADKFSSSRFGGLNGMSSVDITYNALSTGTPIRKENGSLPFLMDDNKMLALMSESWPASKKAKLNDTVKITEGNMCVIRPMAMTISSSTPLDDLHMIFTMLRCDHCFVCDHGALEGVVTTKGLLRAGKASAFQ